MLKWNENGLEMYICKVFDEITKKTKMHVRCLMKCQCEAITPYSKSIFNIILACSKFMN